VLPGSGGTRWQSSRCGCRPLTFLLGTNCKICSKQTGPPGIDKCRRPGI
jgi:hypothetical protein